MTDHTDLVALLHSDATDVIVAQEQRINRGGRTNADIANTIGDAADAIAQMGNELIVAKANDADALRCYKRDQKHIAELLAEVECRDDKVIQVCGELIDMTADRDTAQAEVGRLTCTIYDAMQFAGRVTLDILLESGVDASGDCPVCDPPAESSDDE